jgi:predicted PurR-regulated permease PerM
LEPSESVVLQRTNTLRVFVVRSFVFWSIGIPVAAVVVGAIYVYDVLLLAFAALLLALALTGMASWIDPFVGGRRALSLALILGAFVVVCVPVSILLIPQVDSQTAALSNALPDSLAQAQERLNRYPWGRWLVRQAPSIQEWKPRRELLLRRLTGFVSGTLEMMGLAVVVTFLAIYLTVEPKLYLDGAVHLVPPARRNRARTIFRHVASQLRWWFFGKMVAMTLVGAATWIGLTILGIQLRLTLALVAALLTFIPNFGPFIAAIPAVLIGLLKSPATAGWVAALYIAVQTIESYAVTPLIQRRTVSLPPALTIFSQVVLGVLAGGLGLALATPLTVAALVLVQEVYLKNLTTNDAPTID